jgi:AcrR family transcriptional regulator
VLSVPATLHPCEQRATRQRLIEAAGEIFAQQGYRAATVREICLRAGANVAAINYHFGDKERLYAEVLVHSHTYALERYPYTRPGLEQQPASARLAYYIENFLRRLFDEGRPAWHGRLMIREMVEPTGALDQLIATSIRPQFELLMEIIGLILPADTSEQVIKLHARSVVGQCLFYYYAQPVLERMEATSPSDPAHLHELMDHITRFSLQAMRGDADGPSHHHQQDISQEVRKD